MTTATEPQGEGLEALVRRYRMRCETAREVAAEASRRRLAAVELRLWATLPRGASGLPGAPGTREGVRAACRVAEAVLARGDGPPAGELEPFRPALYESRQFPGCDELFVAIRLPFRFGEDGAEDRGWEPRLQVLRGRLERIGVFEGRWRERPPPPAPAEPWTARPAAGALAVAGRRRAA